MRVLFKIISTKDIESTIRYLYCRLQIFHNAKVLISILYMRLVFFVISPFLTFLRSCFDLQKRSAQICFVLFFGLFGYCHSFEDVRADSYRKYQAFLSSSNEQVGDIITNFKDGHKLDIYESLLFSAVKQITDDPKIMMMIVGLIGGFFCMLLVKRFLSDKRYNYTWPIVILLLFVVMDSGIVSMGGIRKFTAFPLLMYSLIRLILDGKRLWIIGLIVTPLIHISYLIIVILAIISYLIKLPNSLLHFGSIAVCVLSIFVSTSFYGGMIDNLLGVIDSGSVSSRIEMYSDDDVNQEFANSLTTKLIDINNKISALFVALFLIHVKKNRKLLLKTEYELRLYNLLLYFTLIGFFLISFSVVGQRYVYIAMILLYMFMLNAYQRCPIKVKSYIYAMPIVYILHIAWFFYNCYCNTGLDIYYQPLPFLLL